VSPCSERVDPIVVVVRASLFAGLRWGPVVTAFAGDYRYLAQRSLQYFPERRRTTPAAAGMPEAEEVVLDTVNGERVIVWHVPGRGAPIVVLILQVESASSGHHSIVLVPK
jgi:hypothetical protein